MDSDSRLYTRDEFFSAVEEKLKASGEKYDPDWVERFLVRYLEVRDEDEGIERDPSGLGMHWDSARWAIRNDDIGLLVHISTTGGIAALMAQVLQTTPTVSAHIGIFAILSAAFLVGRNILANSIRLTTRQSRLLGELARLGKPVTAEELQERLNGIESAREAAGQHPRWWTASEVQKVLKDLTCIPARNGEPKAIVASDQSGRWWPQGI